DIAINTVGKVLKKP
ncbi:hypothetical protein ACNVD4_03425, partial [Rhizobium sp. BR5]